ncbi:PREDICTED: DNA ligase 3-like, partial [Dipodomys ordii]|uniref:DNA ligase 3-like n=1 Tax=Dipodomys ordii TaxID=10020 RepID=A0A1S3GUZ2_DIPOR
MTLAFKIFFPQNLRALGRKELCLLRKQYHWPEIRQFSQWSETAVLRGHSLFQRRKPVQSFQGGHLRPLATHLVFLPGSHVGLCSGPCEMAEQRFCVDYAKRGTAGCKKCKEKIVKGVCRIGKVVPNPFSESGGDMKEWYHIKCMFEKLERARATTKKIEDLTELEGWEELEDNEKEQITQHIA